MKIAILFSTAVIAGCAVHGTRGDPLEPALSLAAAEREFAAQSVREDSRTAFLAHFADDGFFLRRGDWVEAIPTLSRETAPAIVLDWHPAYVEAARSGEIGVSTGPWRLTAREGSKAPAYGHFVSVWRRDAGHWSVIADIGIGHDDTSPWDAPLETRVALPGPPVKCGSLDDAEGAFARAARIGGERLALGEQGAHDARYYRDGQAPLRGSGAALAGMADDIAMRETVLASQVARSGELAYARGRYAGENGLHGAWLHVWRCEEGRWRVALDVAQAAP